MEARVLIYGATWYTGKLIARAARDAGINAVLSGRGEEKLRTLSSELGLEYRLANLEDRQGLDRAFNGIQALLNAAGPFRRTASPLIAACIRLGVHYLDVAGEAAVIDAATKSSLEAKSRNVMLMPAVGFDVVPSDCLAAHVASRAERPTRLFVGLSGLELLTRGSAITIVEQVGDPIWVRRAGA